MFLGLEHLAALGNDLFLSASKTAKHSRVIIRTFKDEIVSNTRIDATELCASNEGYECSFCPGYFIFSVDAELGNSLNNCSSIEEINDAVFTKSPIRRHRKCHKKVPLQLANCMFFLVKEHHSSPDSKKSDKRALVFDLIESITTMGSNKRYCSLNYFDTFNQKKPVVYCKTCSFYFVSEDYFINTHRALCNAVGNYREKASVLNAVSLLANFSLKMSGVIDPSNTTETSVSANKPL